MRKSVPFILLNGMRKLLIISLLIVIPSYLFGRNTWFIFNRVSSDSIEWRIEMGRINIDQSKGLIIIFSNRTQVYRIIDRINSSKYRVRDRRRDILEVEVTECSIKVSNDDSITIYEMPSP